MPKGTESEIAYIAGLFDGEGYIGVYCGTCHGWRMDTIRVVIKMCDPEGIILCNKLYGGNISVLNAKPKRRKQYKWVLTSRSLIKDFIEDILPHCRVKKDQLILSKEFINTFNGYNKLGTKPGFSNINRSSAMREESRLNKVPSEIISLREAINMKLRNAKRKEMKIA